MVDEAVQILSETGPRSPKGGRCQRIKDIAGIDRGAGLRMILTAIEGTFAPATMQTPISGGGCTSTSGGGNTSSAQPPVNIIIVNDKP